MPRTPEKGELYPYAQKALQDLRLSPSPGNLRKYDGTDDNWKLFSKFVEYRDMENGELLSTENIQQSQSKLPETAPQSEIWDRIVAKAPTTINILFTAPHSSETWQNSTKGQEKDTYQEVKHLAEKLTYHLALKLSDQLGAGVIAWNDEQRQIPPPHNNTNPSYLNID